MAKLLIDVPIPSMGATVNEMTLIDLLCDAGKRIAKGEKLAELESDKSVFDYEAPCDGVVKGVFCRAGDILQVGTPFLRIETEDETLKHLEVNGADAPIARTEETPPSAPLAPAPPAPKRTESPPPSAPPAEGGPRWTPRARKLALERGLQPEAIGDIAGSGPGGRVTGDDVETYASRLAGSGSAVPAPGAPAAPAPDLSRETVRVAGIGYAVPCNARLNTEILKEFPGKTEEEIVKVTGIEQRYVISGDETATSLAAEATEKALGAAGLAASDLDAIIVATLLPDQPVPGAASALALRLGVEKALAFDLNAACSGWLYALEVGRSLIKGGTACNVLVVTAEILSSITNPKDHETAFLFGDGAGAAALTPKDGGHRLYRHALSGDARYFSAICRTGGGALNPIPQPGDDLDPFYLKMDGSVVFKRAVIAFADIIERELERHGLSAEDIAWIVPHQANARILKAVSKRVGIPFEKFVITVNKYGNTSAASVSMALGWAAEEGIFEEGDKIIFCSVGAGFTYAAGLMVW